MDYLLGAGMLLFCLGLVPVLMSAFQKGPMWGWAVALLPVVYPVHIYRNWSVGKVRNGFLVSLVGLAVIATAVYGGAKEKVSDLVEKAPESPVQQEIKQFVEQIPTAGPPVADDPSQVQATKEVASVPASFEEYDPSLDSENVYLEVEPLAPQDDRPTDAPVAGGAEYGYQSVPKASLRNFLGKRIRLTTSTGQTKEGRLTEVNKKSVVVELQYRGGEAAYEYEVFDVTQIEVYALKGNTTQ